MVTRFAQYAKKLTAVGAPFTAKPRTCGPPPGPAPVITWAPAVPTNTPPGNAGSYAKKPASS